MLFEDHEVYVCLRENMGGCDGNKTSAYNYDSEGLWPLLSILLFFLRHDGCCLRSFFAKLVSLPVPRSRTLLPDMAAWA